MYLSDFKVDGIKCLSEARKAAGELVRGIENGADPYWLSLMGHSGTGKTMLASAIWKWFKNEGKWAVEPNTKANIVRDGLYLHYPKMQTRMANGDWGDVQEGQDAWLLVFDEIMRAGERTQAFADAITRILCARTGKWTVITSNLSPKQIGDQIDVRITDRLYRGNNVVVEFNCESYQIRRRK